MIESGFMGVDYISRIYGHVFFVEMHLLVSFFGTSEFMGMILRKFSRISEHTFRKFLRNYG